MPFQIMPDKFLVKINKEKQKYFKQHASINSVIYIPPTNQFEAKNMENGIIVQIGGKCKEFYGDIAKVGLCLIFHWRIEANDKNTREQYFLWEDDTWNYYAVPLEHTRGIWNGNYVVPHKNYVFLKNVSALPEQGEYDEMYKTYLKKTNIGLLTFSKWEDNAVNIAQKVEQLKNKIESLSKSTRTPEIQHKIGELEKERQELNRKSQKAAYLPYKLAYAHPIHNRMFHRKLQEDDILYCLNKGCLYITNFQTTPQYKYIIASIEHVGFLYEKIKSAVDNYEQMDLAIA